LGGKMSLLGVFLGVCLVLYLLISSQKSNNRRFTDLYKVVERVNYLENRASLNRDLIEELQREVEELKNTANK
jgi:phage-related holin